MINILCVPFWILLQKFPNWGRSRIIEFTTSIVCFYLRFFIFFWFGVVSVPWKPMCRFHHWIDWYFHILLCFIHHLLGINIVFRILLPSSHVVTLLFCLLCIVNLIMTLALIFLCNILNCANSCIIYIFVFYFFPVLISFE